MILSSDQLTLAQFLGVHLIFVYCQFSFKCSWGNHLPLLCVVELVVTKSICCWPMDTKLDFSCTNRFCFFRLSSISSITKFFQSSWSHWRSLIDNISPSLCYFHLTSSTFTNFPTFLRCISLKNWLFVAILTR